jgi:RimJ/RimL family protein N-acetyltransferase
LEQPIILIGQLLPLTSHAYLRPVEVTDICPAWVHGLNDPEINQFLGDSRRSLQTRETVARYVVMNQADTRALLMGIFIDGALRGTVRLHKIQNLSADIGILIFDKTYWGKGWAKRAINAIAQFALETLGVRTIWAGMDEGNLASQNVFRAAGFIYDHGTSPQCWKLVQSV